MAEGGENSPPPFEVNEDRHFRNQLLVNLHDLRQSESFTDFTVKVGKTSIPCHRVVLSAACPYFHTMLRSGLQETRKQEVDLHYLDEVVVKQLIEYFYIGSIKLEYVKIKQLIEACELFQIGELKTQCESYITKYLTPENCIEWCRFGGTYNMENLLAKAKKVMCGLFLNVIEGSDFIGLELAELIDYIKNDDVNVKNEDGVLMACIKWIDHDNEHRGKCMTNLVSHVRLQFCTSTFLKYAMTMYPTIMSADGVRKQIHSVIFEASVVKPEDFSSMGRMHFVSKTPKILLLHGNTKNGRNTQGWTLETPAQEWKLEMNIPDEVRVLFRPSICQTDDGLLLTGGDVSSIVSSKVFMYNILGESWMKLQPMPQAKYGHASHCFDRHVYLIGGEGKNAEHLKTIHMFNLEDKTWKNVSSMMHPLYLPITARMDIFIYVVMHSNPGNTEVYDKHGLTLQEFNTVTEKWTMKQPMPSEIITTRGASAVAANDMLYVVGGEGKICTQYSPKTNAWSILKQSSISHIYGSSIVFQGKILLMGGATDGALAKLSDVIEEYNINENIWAVTSYKLPGKLKNFFTTVMYL